MNAEDHARVKTIFFSAIDFPDEKRQAFIKQACSGDDRIEQEVRSLLAHHDSKTMLPTQEPRVTSLREEGVLVEPSVAIHTRGATLHPADTKLVLSELWNENRELLQLRLRIFATIIGLIIGYSIAARALQATPIWAMEGRIACLVIDLMCVFLLTRNRKATLWQMRLLEVILTMNVGCLLVVVDLHQMHTLSNQGSAAMITGASLWSYFIWSLFILTYGVFIPNTWQRAAILLLPIATIPYAVDFVAQQWHPVVASKLQEAGFGLPLPLPFIAAGIAISAANVIHSARLAAFRLRRFAQYELIREISSGGMGKVYAARHVMLKRPCAIKLIQPERTTTRNLEDFEREVRATSKLSHPHTIEVYDFGQTNEGLFFYVMELLPGKNLRELVEESGPLAPSRTIHFLIQICGALEEAHGLGLVHRDIKPANIFASERGGIFDFTKLLDFGLVRLKVSELDKDDRPSGFTAGTPDYMSPEQIVDYRNIDVQSDIYSLGAVAYFLLVGHPPFQGDTDLDVLIAHTREPVTPPLSLRPEIGSELNQIVLKCLEKSAIKRFASVRELKRALSACSMAQSWTQEDAANWWKRHQASEERL